MCENIYISVHYELVQTAEEYIVIIIVHNIKREKLITTIIIIWEKEDN